MKAKNLGRLILSFAVSAALLAEPFAGMPAVRAEEPQAAGWEDMDKNNDQHEQEKPGAAVDPETENGGGKTEEAETGSGGGNAEEAETGNGGGNAEEAETGNGGGNAEEAETGNGGGNTEDPETGNNGESPEIPGGNGGNESEGIPGAGSDGGNEKDPGEENDGGADDVPGRVNGTDGGSDSSAEDETDEAAKETDGFSDMPDGYRLTSFQRELKADLAGSLSRIRERDEGETYAAGRVFTFAGSREEAEQIAEAYHAEIEDFDMGVLTLRLDEEETVRAAVRAASDMGNNLPAVWPDYRRELYEETFPDTAQDETAELESAEEEYSVDGGLAPQGAGEDISAREAYEQVLNGLDGFQDPYLDPADGRYQWFHTAIGSPYAWDAGYTGRSVTVGVVDSGVSPNPDLDGNLAGGRDFCDGTPDAKDCAQHGTHVAGTIAALANGEQGVGVAPDAKIYNAKVFGDDVSKSGYDSTIMRAILYLINEEDNSTENVNSEAPRVDIINMSLGGSGDTTGFQAVLDKARAKGVIVFAATGNDGASTMMYPASYDHVIAVAATDNNNQRAYFSNYGFMTDLSAPGVDIWAPYADGDGNASYASLQGTSMACPVAAGEAAVILSGQNDLPALKDKTGAGRVDALEEIMKSNAVSAGAGMGKGITSLAKVFNLSTAVMKPNAPGIDITDNSDNTGQSVEVTITAQAGTRLCYTTNGANPVYKNEETNEDTTLVDGNSVTFTIDGSQAAQGTVKAFAIDAGGVISSVKSKKYKLSPYVRSIIISGPARVERGRSIQLAASVTPAYAADKTVAWELRDSEGEAADTAEVRIDAKGRITAAEGAGLGTYTAIARAGDGGKAEAAYTVSVVREGAAVSSLAFDKNMKKELWITKEDSAPAVDLSKSLAVKEKDASGNVAALTGDQLEDRVIWTSSKPAVAEVDSRGVVTAKSAGTATITARANDNSNKKVSAGITVKQGVTEITITTGKGGTAPELFTVAAGRSMALKASVSPSRPANKKVKWSISPATPDVTVNPASGKISVRAGTASGTYIVTASAADGKGASASQAVKVCSGAVGTVSLDVSKVTLYTRKVDEGKTDTRTITATIAGDGGRTDFDPNAYTVTSSDESVVKAASETAAGGKVHITLTAAGGRYGKARVVVASADGSNKKAVCTVTVSGGIKKVELQDSAGNRARSLKLFRAVGSGAPETATLKAVVKGTEGANTAAYDVVSSNPALVKVSVDKTTNEIILSASEKSTGKAAVTLKATDGSGRKAVCNVTVSNPASRINIAPKAGATRYVVPGKSTQLTATFETEYGKAASKNVAWQLSGQAAEMGITVSSSGKVSAPRGLEGRNEDFTVTAVAKDGSGIRASYTIRLRQPTTYFTMQPSGNGEDPYKVYNLYTAVFKSDCTAPVSCTSSSPKTASPSVVYIPYNPKTGKGGTGYIMFMATRAGRATFTVKALDSSNETYKMACVFQENGQEE